MFDPNQHSAECEKYLSRGLASPVKFLGARLLTQSSRTAPWRLNVVVNGQEQAFVLQLDARGLAYEYRILKTLEPLANHTASAGFSMGHHANLLPVTLAGSCVSPDLGDDRHIQIRYHNIWSSNVEAQTLFQLVDLSVVIIANLNNLLLTAMFLLRGCGSQQIGNRFGWAAVGLGIPLAVAAALNAAGERPGWTIALPVLMVAYDAVEFLLDFILKFDFRHTRWLGPYLAVFYLALMGMIGYAFATGKLFGFITLATYFVCLAATAFSYARVKHG